MLVEERMNQIERIGRMEQLFDFVSTAIKELPKVPEKYEEIESAIAVLSEYYSNDWKHDYLDDEAGFLPKELERGVLSEDGLWNLFSDWNELKEQLPIR